VKCRSIDRAGIIVKSTGSSVSIVVPAYNAAETIGEALESLAAQTYGNLEVVVVDDGSTDLTGDVSRSSMAKFKVPIKLIRQENAGQAAALNTGWTQSSGDYLGYLAADDVLYPDGLAKLAQFLDEHPEIAGAYPDYDLIDANSKVIRRICAPEFDAHDLVERSICQPGPGVLFRRGLFERTGGWNREYRQMPDFEFWLRFVQHGNMARLPEFLAGYRVHEGSQTFAPPSAIKCEEPPKLMAAFLADAKGAEWNVPRAMAWSHVLAARLHLRAGRFRLALHHLMKASRLHPFIILAPRLWRLLMGGAVGRIRYHLTASTSAAQVARGPVSPLR
jgi:glycosyltransferase involved in cell wall biosynthesis